MMILRFPFAFPPSPAVTSPRFPLAFTPRGIKL